MNYFLDERSGLILPYENIDYILPVRSYSETCYEIKTKSGNTLRVLKDIRAEFQEWINDKAGAAETN